MTHKNVMSLVLRTETTCVIGPCAYLYMFMFTKYIYIYLLYILREHNFISHWMAYCVIGHMHCTHSTHFHIVHTVHIVHIVHTVHIVNMSVIG